MYEEDVARTMFLHGAEELDNDLGAWSDQNLALSSLFGVVDVLQGIVEDGCFDHGGDRESTGLSRKWRFSSRKVGGLEVSIYQQSLAFSSLERKECPSKGSSARCRDEKAVSPAPRPCYGS